MIEKLKLEINVDCKYGGVKDASLSMPNEFQIAQKLNEVIEGACRPITGKRRRLVRMLAVMEAIAGCKIPQKPPRTFKAYTHPKLIKTGSLNKICSGCGHKNKKCTCRVEK